MSDSTKQTLWLRIHYLAVFGGLCVAAIGFILSPLWLYLLIAAPFFALGEMARRLSIKHGGD